VIWLGWGGVGVVCVFGGVVFLFFFGLFFFGCVVGCFCFLCGPFFTCFCGVGGVSACGLWVVSFSTCTRPFLLPPLLQQSDTRVVPRCTLREPNHFFLIIVQLLFSQALRLFSLSLSPFCKQPAARSLSCYLGGFGPLNWF